MTLHCQNPAVPGRYLGFVFAPRLRRGERGYSSCLGPEDWRAGRSRRDETYDAIILKPGLTIAFLQTADPRLHRQGRRVMAGEKVTRGMTATDRIVAWIMVAGIALVLIGYAQSLALPAHFV